MSMTSISHFSFKPSVSALRCLQGHCLFGSCSFLLPFWFNAGLLILPEPKEHCKAVPTCETQIQVKHAYYWRKKLLFQLVFGLRFVASALHLIFDIFRSFPPSSPSSKPPTSDENRQNLDVPPRNSTGDSRLVTAHSWDSFFSPIPKVLLSDFSALSSALFWRPPSAHESLEDSELSESLGFGPKER